jgi:hypothetical protein
MYFAGKNMAHMFVAELITVHGRKEKIIGGI